MSYCTQNRFGHYTVEYWDPSTKYNGVASWWPDFGHGGRDFSHQKEHDCVGHIFNRIVAPHDSQKKPVPPAEPPLRQFRHPAPSTEALMVPGRREAVGGLGPETQHHCSLNRLEARARRMASWIGDAPVLSRIGSEPALSSAQSVRETKSVYTQHGWLQKQHCTAGRRLRPPRSNSFVFANQIFANRARPAPARPSKQWRICPENSFQFSRQFQLPVPKAGGSPQVPWLELPWEWGTGAAGRTAGPVPFAKKADTSLISETSTDAPGDSLRESHFQSTDRSLLDQETGGFDPSSSVEGSL